MKNECRENARLAVCYGTSIIWEVSFYICSCVVRLQNLGFKTNNNSDTEINTENKTILMNAKAVDKLNEI